MAERLNAPKGTKDLLPEDAARFRRVEDAARERFALAGYGEIRTPIFEHTELFARGIGEGTDIVGKEMYTFTDRGDRSVTLRPENTAGVARAYVEHKVFAVPGPHRFWYAGPMFRYERPQAGRQRQFHQLGVECLGSETPASDAEAIALGVGLLDDLGLTGLAVQINSVGCSVCRPRYREALVAYLRAHQDGLCSDCRTRTETNPLRALDCKVPGCAPILAAAPPISASWCDECRHHQARVEALLEAASVRFARRERLVRGLDYYTRTVFEVVSDALGAQSTVLAGGRYNGLVAEIGGPETPAVGWALGMERLAMLLPEAKDAGARATLAVAMPRDEAAETAAFALVEALRREGLAVALAPVAKADKQFKLAERLGARFGLLLGPDELAAGTVSVKDLAARTQSSVPTAEVVAALVAAEAGDPLS